MILSEFLDDNAHKCYPFALLNELPTNFIVDAKFMVTGNIDRDKLYIDSIELTSTHIRIYLATKVNNILTPIGCVLACPIPSDRNHEYACKLVNNDYEIIVDGFITFGEVPETLIEKSIIILAENGNIFQNCVIPVTEWCTGIKVNNRIYTGIVTLTADEGITFDVQSTGDRTDIVMKYSGFARPEDLTIDTKTDEELLSEVVSSWGSPVTSISGVLPDANGNITINVDADSADSLKITTGINALTITDTAGSYSDTENTMIQDLMTNISSLNERATALEKFSTQFELQTNTLSHEVSKLQG
jgi:hypothetical protein